MAYTIQHIAGILAAPATLATPMTPVEYLSTDSRRIAFPAVTLFFALQTERRDAHQFIPALYERGVINFVVHHGFQADAYPGANFIYCDNTLKALQQLAASHRGRFSYPVIGITGSSGKTIIKEWLHQLLAPDFNIVRSPRSYNSQVGVPLSVWQMDETHTLAIFEAGISRPGEMEALALVIQPTIGIFTNIGEAHSAGFINFEQKAEEKAVLFKHCNDIIYCNDHPIVRTVLRAWNNAVEQATGRPAYMMHSWGKEHSAGVQVIRVEKSGAQSTITVVYNDNELLFTIPFSDEASIENAMHCCTTCLALGMPAITLQQRLLQLHPIEMRLQLMQGINNCAVINDSYSFDISSFATALDFLGQQQQYAQKTVIISDIPGVKGTTEYVQAAAMLKARSVQRLITIGPNWNVFIPQLQQQFAITQHYPDTAAFIHQFNASQFRNEAILLKGARAFAFESIAALLEKKVHQTVLEINLNAIVHNLNEYRSRLKKGVKVMAMVKAFAYGSGSTEVAGLLQFHKVDYLAVAYADEGVELRKAGINLPIMVMNADEAAFETIVQHNLEPELFSFSILKAFHAFLERQALLQYPVHIKLDTGMHRLGFEEDKVNELAAYLQQYRQVAVQSVFSHLAASEDPAEDAFTQQQAAAFEKSCAILKAALGYGFIMHLSNSAAIFRNPALQYDMVRLGIGMYGIDSANEQQLALQTAATLKTTIAQLRTVKAGESVGYNRRGRINTDSLIATIRIGYADGFSRRLGNGNGYVWIRGHKAPVVGSVCMDMTMVDVTGVPGVQEEDDVEIFGKHITLNELATRCGTIPYEIMTGISQRVKRVYSEE